MLSGGSDVRMGSGGCDRMNLTSIYTSYIWEVEWAVVGLTTLISFDLF